LIQDGGGTTLGVGNSSIVSVSGTFVHINASREGGGGGQSNGGQPSGSLDVVASSTGNNSVSSRIGARLSVGIISIERKGLARICKFTSSSSRGLGGITVNTPAVLAVSVGNVITFFSFVPRTVTTYGIKRSSGAAHAVANIAKAITVVIRTATGGNSDTGGALVVIRRLSYDDTMISSYGQTQTLSTKDTHREFIAEPIRITSTVARVTH
jgi:hypothetical protein